MIRYADSFSMYDTANMGLAWDKITNAGTKVSIDAGKLKISPNEDTSGVEKVFDAQDTWIISTYFKGTGGGGRFPICYAKDGNDTQWFCWTYGNRLRINRYSAEIAYVDLPTLDCHLQIKIKIGAIDGTVDVLVDGVSILSLAGQNTQSTANATADTIGFGCPVGNIAYGTTYISNLVIMDGQGTINNDLSSNILRVKGAIAASDSGTNELTPSAGTDHYDCVDNIPPSSSVYLSGITGTELFGMGSDPFTEEAVYLKGVLVKACAMGETEATSAKLLAKSGATLGESAAKTIQPTVYKYHTAAFETDPATGLAWSRAAAVGAQYGIEVV